MEREELSNYRKWVGKSPFEIRLEVQQRNGWAEVFRGGFPRWAHRLRNYFNVTPAKLMRLDTESAAKLLKTAKKFELAVDCARALNAKRMTGSPHIQMPKHCTGRETDLPWVHEQVILRYALSGDVYLDEEGRSWFQMSAGGAIYHYGTMPKSTLAEGAWAESQGQAACPIFKLVSPDGTGGSCECIIKNTRTLVRASVAPVYAGHAHIGSEVLKFVDVSKLIVSERKWQGSYNYGETVQVGFAQHKKFDVTPHEKGGSASYIDPPPGTTLFTRRFPASFSGKDLAAQI